MTHGEVHVAPGEDAGAKGVSRTLAALVVAASVAAVAGWIFDIAVLRSLVPGLAAMKFNTALGFALAGTALGFLTFNVQVARVLAGLAAAFGVLTLSQYLFGWDIGIDRLFIAHLDRVASPEWGPHPGRMTWVSAVNFVLIGVGIALTDYGPQRTQRPSQWLALIAGLCAFVVILGYLFSAPQLYSSKAYSSMALPSAITFVILSCGLLAARPREGLMRRVTANDAGGLLIRRLVPAAILLSPIIGWLRLTGSRAGFFPQEVGMALFATANIAIFTSLIWWAARAVRRADFEKRNAMQSLAASEAHLRTVLNSALTAVISIDAKGLIVDWNVRAERMFGWTRREALGRELAETILPEHFRKAHRAGMERYTATGKGRVLDRMMEMTALRRDGTEFPVELSISAIGVGSTFRFCGFITDITERKQSQVKLHAQLTRLDLLHRITRAIGERQDLDSIFQVVIRSLETDLPIDFSCICLFNELEQTLTVRRIGARASALSRELMMVERADIPIGTNGLAKAVRGEVVYEPDLARVDTPFTTQLASAGLRSLVIAPLKAEGYVTGVLIVARQRASSFTSPDCEFLKQLSEHVGLAVQQVQLYGALQNAYDELRQSQQTIMQQERLRALGQMASGIAHDINNAISPVALYTESMIEREPNLSPQARENLVTIQRAIEDVARTVARMREFYRPREASSEMLRVNLNELIEQTVGLTRARWSDLPQSQGISIAMQTHLDAGLPPILGEESEIRDALTNLIFNAVDAMPSGGALSISTSAISDTTVRLEIGDTGSGMSEEIRRRCLEPFFTTKGERGTGLGLAMVYGMVQRHSGEMQIDSEEGKGTVVRILFPVASLSTAVDTPPPPPPRPVSALNILVVDDDPLLLESLRDAFESDGHRVTAADGGQAGIDTFVEALNTDRPFDVVVTDLGMPHVDGRKVAAAVHAASAKTPIILLTGWGQRLLAENDVPPEVSKVLSKPPRLLDLRSALAEVIADGE